MLIIENELTCAFDVDNTLILWRDPKKDSDERIVTLTDPYDGKERQFVIHRPHVKLLKDYKARGFHITVWSHAGAPWVATVVRALGLEDYVDIAKTKLVKYVDDTKADEVLGTRVFINY